MAGISHISSFLTQIPAMPLPKLKSLDLSFNNLPTIPPDSTANLTRLRALDLSFNDLTAVPVVSIIIFNIPSLELNLVLIFVSLCLRQPIPLMIFVGCHSPVTL